MAKAEHRKAMRGRTAGRKHFVQNPGKQPAAFREALGVRTRRRVAFNRVLQLLDEILGESTVGRFAKKSKSFGFSAFQFFKYHPNAFNN
jgi:hypothetical protein